MVMGPKHGRDSAGYVYGLRNAKKKKEEEEEEGDSGEQYKI